MDDQSPGPKCTGCDKDIEEGAVVAFGDSLFHLECFVCAKCNQPADCESNLLLLTDGRPVCEQCSYTCVACKTPIQDEAIMTGQEAYHAACFKCVACDKQINDLVFTQTTKGVYCTPCYEYRKNRRREERGRRKQQQQQQQQLQQQQLRHHPQHPQRPPQSQHQPHQPLQPHQYANKGLPSPPAEVSTLQPHPQLRPNALHNRPYMANRFSSRLFDSQMVDNYMQSEAQTESPTPTRSLSSTLSQSKSTPALVSKPTPSRSEGIPRQKPTPKRLSRIDDNDDAASPPLPQQPSSPDSTTSSTHTPFTPLDLALPEFPSLNLSFFENDSVEMINLTKQLGANLDLLAKSDQESLHLEAEFAATQQPSSSASKVNRASELLSSSLGGFPEPPDESESSPSSEDNKTEHKTEHKTEQDWLELNAELQLTKRKLADMEANFQKIKEASKRALDEFSRARKEFAKETQERQQHEHTILQLRQQLAYLQKIQVMGPARFAADTRAEIERVALLRADLERACNNLKEYRTALAGQIDESVQQQQAGLVGTPAETLQKALLIQVQSLRLERDTLQSETDALAKSRDEIINEMVMLNTKNAELTSMNNDLSRRVTEREREAAAVMAGTSFVNRSTSDTTGKVVSRDSFNGTTAPKLFKIKKKNTVFGKKFSSKRADTAPAAPYGLGSNMSVQSLAGWRENPPPPPSYPSRAKHSQDSNHSGNHGTHAFQPYAFLRPTKCDACGDKIWGRADFRCQGCGYCTHAKCLSHVPQLCHASTTTSSLDLLSDSDPMVRTQDMFGTDLQEQAAREDRLVPLIVEKCIVAVELRGLDFEGIYRKSGGAAQMRTIQNAFEDGSPLDLNDPDQINDICAVTSVLKNYFRQLPNPLLTYEQYPKFIDAADMEPGPAKIDRFLAILAQLPKPNYETLKILIAHLNRVCSHSDENLMTTKNLAMVFGPTLMRDRDSSRDLIDMSAKNATVDFLISHFAHLFSA